MLKGAAGLHNGGVQHSGCVSIFPGLLGHSVQNFLLPLGVENGKMCIRDRWEGLDKNTPEHALTWKGEPWNGKTSEEKGAHPNSRFTAPAKNCPCISDEFDSTSGVPISAIIFGGRRAQTTPLVYQSRDWANGVFVGSIMASETTAAAAGAVGVVRRDPMAMLPFCGYHMGDYFKHWFEMGDVLGDKAPKTVSYTHLDVYKRQP